MGDESGRTKKEVEIERKRTEKRRLIKYKKVNEINRSALSNVREKQFFKQCASKLYYVIL